MFTADGHPRQPLASLVLAYKTMHTLVSSRQDKCVLIDSPLIVTAVLLKRGLQPQHMKAVKAVLADYFPFKSDILLLNTLAKGVWYKQHRVFPLESLRPYASSPWLRRLLVPAIS